MSIKTVLRQVAEVELSKPVSTGLKWSSLAAACTLVFAVQLGVQTLPMLLSGWNCCSTSCEVSLSLSIQTHAGLRFNYKDHQFVYLETFFHQYFWEGQIFKIGRNILSANLHFYSWIKALSTHVLLPNLPNNTILVHGDYF